MKIQTTIKKWGNSLAIRITGPLKNIPHFTLNMPIEVEINEKGLKIYPIGTKKQNSSHQFSPINKNEIN